MSKTAAIHFIHKVGGDPALQQQISGLNGNIAGLLRVAAETGYNFTGDDWNIAVAELADAMMDEISEEDLDHVAGGTITFQGSQEPLNSFSWGASFLPPNVSMYYYKPGM